MNKRFVVLLFISFIILPLSARIDTLKIFSRSMQKTIPNLVITPDGYSRQSEALPVVYLLHGAYGDYKDWYLKGPDIVELSNVYHVIIVCPDGGYNSWYFDSPTDKKARYESYFSKELVPAIDEKYNTIARPGSRAITGLSMGGHGAFFLSFRHPEIWGAAGSMSGGVNLEPFPGNWNISDRLGRYSKNKEVWRKHSVINMLDLPEDKSLKLIFDCGTEDFFYSVNRDLHDKMLERKIPHTYIEHPGKHNWEYWKRALNYHFVFFNEFFIHQNKQP